MANIAIVTDSTAYIPQHLLKQHNITVIPLQVIFEGESYEEIVELATDEFYEKLKKTNALPTTSQPSLGTFIQTFEKLAEDHETILTIHLSSGISGTYQTAVTAGEQVEADVHVFDSEISCMPQGYYVIEAAKMAESGQDIDTILSRLEELKKNTKAYFVVDDLYHLQRGGRLNGAQAIVGSLLQIKPILHFEDKRIVPFEKVRTEKKALNRVFYLFDEDAADGTDMRATVIHANRPEKAQAIQKQLAEKYPHVEIDTSFFGPVIGTHLGEGSIGIGWCKL